MQRLPDLTGLKNEVIIPEYSRNVYDHAIRMVGVKIVEVNTRPSSNRPSTSAPPWSTFSPDRATKDPSARKSSPKPPSRNNVPVIVDAAAEILTLIPNVHLERGATAVAYSGGKCIRGPQAAGLLLGEKNLLQAAWANSAPHHAFGRSLKVGKEEIMGMLAAVEMWKKRDHDAEWKKWLSSLNHISEKVSSVKGVTTEVVQPRGLSNKTPSLRIRWEGAAVGITGSEVAKQLLDNEPRIVVAGGTGFRPNRMESTVTITPYMMMPGDEKVVADRLYAVLSKPPQIEAPKPPQGDTVSVNGQWNVHIEYTRGSADHIVHLEQTGTSIVGTHRGEFLTGDLMGSVAGNEVRFHSSHKFEGTRLSYDFAGRLAGDTLQGSVDMGEYGTAKVDRPPACLCDTRRGSPTGQVRLSALQNGTNAPGDDCRFARLQHPDRKHKFIVSSRRTGFNGRRSLAQPFHHFRWRELDLRLVPFDSKVRHMVRNRRNISVGLNARKVANGIGDGPNPSFPFLFFRGMIFLHESLERHHHPEHFFFIHLQPAPDGVAVGRRVQPRCANQVLSPCQDACALRSANALAAREGHQIPTDPRNAL